jgi:hypothetical protein
MQGLLGHQVLHRLVCLAALFRLGEGASCNPLARFARGRAPQDSAGDSCDGLAGLFAVCHGSPP